ncbi:Uu.00g036640.m01.CDS01 [Anthostomella pinea]|uniref:Uu.00g036640.m01.CDS01 n=1 Tax=Anthostomella pinea TaxID=933095 RepID=A0AAI8V9H2_9PEZI|nr:Uu.00g036640.m01.CDS01 [Anthostomella pinea]
MTIYKMMVILFLDFQADEFMEAVARPSFEGCASAFHQLIDEETSPHAGEREDDLRIGTTTNSRLIHGRTLLLGLLALPLYLGYRAILPKPLAGIPYNRDAAGKLFGDVPEMMGYVMGTKRIFCWLTSLTSRHNSAIIQAFIKPGSLPWVVVTDPFEAQDILLRRKEFDRSGFFGELIGGILPEQHIQFLSSDSRFKNNRNLINHLMAPTFIRTVSAPEVYKSISTLIKVWQVKADMAKGRPFSTHHDITYAALDGIFASSFGLPEEESITKKRLEAISEWKGALPSNADEPVSFPDAEVPQPFASVLILSNSVTDTQLSPAPVLTSWVLRKFPYMKKAIAIKDDYIRNKVEESMALINKGDTEPRNALHSVCLREKEVAEKEGRQPDYQKRGIADEFFGFMMAGHDTSATAVAWGVKMLTDKPSAQDELRATLHAEFPQALSEKRAPTYEELSKAHIPYLDAVVEEVLRHANTIAFVVRQALQDTVVLGCHIPKGTDVFLMANGAGYLEPNMTVSDDVRSPGARRGTGKALSGTWDDGNIGKFRPERWLTAEDKTFNSMAGPQLAFGLGTRGCFGKRLAIQTLKMQFALIVWYFKLLPTPAELSGYDAVQKFAREPTQCYVRLEKALNESTGEGQSGDEGKDVRVDLKWDSADLAGS